MAKRINRCIVKMSLIVSLLALASPVSSETITGFVGSVTKPVMEEIRKLYAEKTGNEIIVHYGGSGNLLSQMKLSQTGDIYLSGSPDFMEKAKREELIEPDSIKIIAYLIPAINVPKGNPKNIKLLRDLLRDDVQLVIANPRTVCVGLYAVEVFEANHLASLMRPGIKSFTASCEQTANLIALGGTDAVMGWEVFRHWNPEKIETVFLKPEEVPRISYIPIAISTFSQKRKVAEDFITVVASPEGKRMFTKWGYITDEQEVRKYAPRALIGGEYNLPPGW